MLTLYVDHLPPLGGHLTALLMLKKEMVDPHSMTDVEDILLILGMQISRGCVEQTPTNSRKRRLYKVNLAEVWDGGVQPGTFHRNRGGIILHAGGGNATGTQRYQAITY